MNIKGKRFLLIGGAGLIGSHTADELLKEDVKEVIIYDNLSSGSAENLENALQDSRCKIFQGGGDILRTDVLDLATKDIDGVFHFAALWLLQCHENPALAFEVNVRGTFNILASCVKNKVKRFLFSSSKSVYGDVAREPVTEDHPLNGTTFYGMTKIAGEHMCRAFYHKYKLPYVGLRYMNVYGTRQNYKGAYIAVIMKILERLDKGLPPIVYGDGSQGYDFVYVEDCARANVCAMKGDVVDSFYNVGTGIKTTIKELAELLVRVTGSDLKIQYEAGGKTFEKDCIASTEKARREIGFEAKVGLKEGLGKLIEWRRLHGS